MEPEEVCFLCCVSFILEAPVCALGWAARARVCRNMVLLETPEHMNDHTGDIRPDIVYKIAH